MGSKERKNVCIKCGSEFSFIKPKRITLVFCKSCRKEFFDEIRLNNMNKKLKPKTCIVCGNEYMPKTLSQKYCSQDCSPHPRSRGIIKTYDKERKGYKCVCKYCNEIFYGKAYNSKMCNKEHYKKCEYCGNDFLITRKNKKNKTCSYDCSIKLNVQKGQKTNLERYGCISTLQDPNTKKKIEETNLRLYGDTQPLRSNAIKERIQATCLQKYGCKVPLQSDYVKEKIRQTNIKKCGRPHLDQAHIKHFDDWQNLNGWLDKNSGKYNLLELLEYFNVTPRAIMAKISNEEKRKIKDYGKISLEEQYVLRELYKIGFSDSDITLHNRKIIRPKELDIILNYYNVAIEVSPLWTHNIKKVKDKYYHQNKVVSAYNKGINLITLFNEKDIDKYIEYIKHPKVLSNEHIIINGSELGIYDLSDYELVRVSEPEIFWNKFNTPEIITNKKMSEIINKNIDVITDNIIDECYKCGYIGIYDCGYFEFNKKDK